MIQNETEVNPCSYSQVLQQVAEQFITHLQPVAEAVKDWKFAEEELESEAPGESDYFYDFAAANHLNDSQLLWLCAALISYTHPTFYYSLQTLLNGKKTNALGTHNDLNTGIVYPTVQTLLYLIHGNDYQKSIATMQQLLNDPLVKTGVLEFTPLSNAEIKNNLLNQVVSVSSDYLAYFLTGDFSAPRFSHSFPAQKISTPLTWNDLVLEAGTQQQVNELTGWQKHSHQILNDWELHKIIKPGYRALFYGPSGTGKTLAASLIGKELGLDVYRIDLSMVVSKYIGETEKNLAGLFRKAEHKNWILFFDEADALFSTRTNVRDAHDRYANQEVSYLLQRVEDYGGIVILASNLKSNIDKAFARRFQLMIEFKMPNAILRKRLWQNCFSGLTQLQDETMLDDIAKSYEIAGGSIINVVQYASLMAINRGDNIIYRDDIKTGVLRELHKEGRSL